MKPQEIELEKKSIYWDYVHTPEGYEVKRDKIKSSALFHFFIEQNRLSGDPTNHTYNDFKVDYMKEVDYFLALIRERYAQKKDRGLVLNKSWCNVYYPGEMSLSRNQLKIGNLEQSPDYTLVYGLDVVKDSTNLVIEWETNRKYTLNWTMPMENNKYAIFPSGCNYYFTKNKADQINVFFGATYTEI